MDHLAAEGTLGRTIPIARGITPGSGPAHLALFGYDPLDYEVGRGVLESVGVGLDIEVGDIAARGNFCTLDSSGNISDRRAGRIATEDALPIVERLKGITLPKVTPEIRHVKEYRFALVLRGESLHHDIEDTDPQATGVPPLLAKPKSEKAVATAQLFDQWVEKAHEILKDEPKANGLTLRGFSTNPQLPQFQDIFGLRAACIAVYPMYKGVSKLVGMEVIPFEGDTPKDEFSALKQVWSDHDFFFVHIKKTDSAGEDGDFEGKAKVIEQVDRSMSALLELSPDVIAITGDHSTPSKLRSHSWHPVPLLIWAPQSARIDPQHSFGETMCASGELGTISATDLLPLLLAHAGRLEKFGA
jgi:2,3-bisphosphoglycerate-independent phosphoglycerate mutase